MAAVDKQTSQILGVIIDRDHYKDSNRKDIKDFKVQWPNIFTELKPGELTGDAKIFRVNTIPVYVIFDDSGKILYRGDELEAAKKILLE